LFKLPSFYLVKFVDRNWDIVGALGERPQIAVADVLQVPMRAKCRLDPAIKGRELPPVQIETSCHAEPYVLNAHPLVSSVAPDDINGAIYERI
jgi:hypothetical protein